MSGRAQCLMLGLASLGEDSDSGCLLHESLDGWTLRESEALHPEERSPDGRGAASPDAAVMIIQGERRDADVALMEDIMRSDRTVVTSERILIGE
ncbi:UNVERIFIED_CONTAM: hypothetical protein PYX00_009228 [Menopon gallinae]|uniref:Uncharacterized protein n=1 Tax=Menopon gallinae TaxID=328185 RepID=A0AAW2HA90_9NEOP